LVLLVGLFSVRIEIGGNLLLVLLISFSVLLSFSIFLFSSFDSFLFSVSIAFTLVILLLLLFEVFALSLLLLLFLFSASFFSSFGDSSFNICNTVSITFKVYKC
jgi:hypothetical protein